MLKNENIICISWIEWDFVPVVMHQMMRRLAKNNRVLYVVPPVAYSNLIIRPSMWKKHCQSTRMWLRGVYKDSENLYVYYPPPLILQFGHSIFVDKANQELVAFSVRKVAGTLAFDSPILWVYHPYVFNPRGKFNEKVICYDCNDDVGFFYCQHFDKRKRLSELEKGLTERADVVFTTSTNLFNLRKDQNPNTHYLPSGLDFELFNAACSPALKVAQELSALTGPVIGFIGGMENTKMNWQWIKQAADAKPLWNFIFIGPCFEPPPSYVSAQKNIMFLGSKPQKELSAYLKAFNVCLIPYKGEDFLNACQPTKAFEYLAAGKPVVASQIPELEAQRYGVYLSRDFEEFIRNIELALEDGKKAGEIASYVESARGHTWDERVEKASSLIESAIDKKNQRGR